MQETKNTPQERYKAKYCKQYKFELNTRTNADMIEHLSKIGNVQGYIKKLIQADMQKSGE